MTKASIITLSRNGIKNTRMCVDSVFRNTSGPFELIIVDQGSTDGTAEYLQKLQREHTHVKIVTNDHDIGFAAGNNQAAKLAEGSILVFLNNDVIVPSCWLADLTYPLLEDSTLAATGPTSNQTGELQLDRYSASKIRKIPADIESYAAARRQLMAGKIWYFHRLAGFCLAVKKRVFDETGGFNERLTFFEDDDLCRRIMEKGYRLAIIPSVFVYHFGSSTFKALHLNVDLLIQINRAKFLYEVTYRDETRKFAKLPKVSVIVATYNRPHELEAALQSIRAQTYTNWEAIVVNDGGQDLRQVVEDLRDKRFKYIDSKHLGKPGALNLALSQAIGKYIAYLDDDDAWYPEHLQVCVVFLERNRQIGAVYTKAVRKEHRRNADGTRGIESEYIYQAMEFAWTRLLQANWIPNLSLVHRRSLLQQVPAFRDLPILEDYDFLLRLSSVAELAHLPLVTGEYHIDESKESRNERLRRTNPDLYYEILAEISATQRMCETSEALRIAGNLFRLNGDSSQALRLAGRALQTNPLNYWALRLFVESSYKCGTYKHLRARLERFLRDRPDKSDVWKAYALDWYRKKKYVKALRALEMALVARETEGAAKTLYQLMSMCYHKLGIEETAIACMSRSLPIAQSRHELPVLSEGAILDQWFKRGVLATPLKGLSYYYLYSKRWGKRAAMRKMLQHATGR